MDLMAGGLVASILGPTDLAAVFMVCGVIVMFLRSRTKNLTLTMGKMSATLNAVSDQVRAVDLVVNNRLPAATTMSEDVTAARITLEEARLSLTELENYVVYQHDANHKLVNMITPLTGLLPMFLAKLESIDARLDSASSTQGDPS